MKDSDLETLTANVRAGGGAKYHEKNAAEGKLFARERLARLLDPGSFVEDGTLANSLAEASGANTSVSTTTRPTRIRADITVALNTGATRHTPLTRANAQNRLPSQVGSCARSSPVI